MDAKLKKRVSLVIIILLVLEIPFFLYLVNLKVVAFNKDFYKKEFDKYNVYEEFPEEDIEVINSELLDYFKYDKTDNFVGIDLFDEREKEHLRDVKDLVQAGLVSLNILIVLFVLLLIGLSLVEKKDFMKKFYLVLLYGGIVTFLDALIFFIMVKLNFNWFFDIFHRTFFKEGTWLFDEGSGMIKLYTANFFFDATLTIVVSTLVIAFMLILAALFIKKRLAERKE